MRLDRGGHRRSRSRGDEQAPARRGRIVQALRLVARAAPGALTGLALVTLVSGYAPIAAAWLTKLLVDGLIDQVSAQRLIVLVIGLAGTGIVAAVLPHLTKYLRAELDRKVGALALDRLFGAVDRLDGLERFEDPAYLDRLRLAQQSSGSAPHPAQAVNGLFGVAQSTFTIAGFVVSLYVLAPVLTAVVVAAGLPVLLAELRLAKRRARVLWDAGPAERREFFYASLLSTVEAAKEIRLFGLGAFLRTRMLANRGEVNRAERRVDRRALAIQTCLGLLSASVSGGGLVWAILAARSGRITVGDITVFVAALSGVQGALVTFATDLARTHQSLLLFAHFTQVLDTPSDLSRPARPLRVPMLRHGIEFRDVWFRYSPEHPWILRGVSLAIGRGSSVALVGLNGAGKSTLVKLLCRLYDPTHGSIHWDGVDIRDLELDQLRWRIGAVFQDYMEYDLTAAENIALGDLQDLGELVAGSKPPRVQQAAIRAGVHDTIRSLPHGYETLLSRMFFMHSEKDSPETGVELSGGQWQRLALARALLRDQRDLMILDEPSSGLDAEAEHEIHATLRRHRAGRTSLLISHRLGTVRDADVILVLAGGRIIEAGNHRELIAADGEYRRLFSLQAAGYDLLGERSAVSGS